MPRIRVLLSSSTMAGGGSERQLLYLLRGLDRSHFEPILYLLRDTGEFLPQIPSDVEKVAFWTNRNPPWLNWPGRIHHQQVQHLAETLREKKIAVAYDRLFHMTMISGPACTQAGVPRVSTIVSPPQFDLERAENRWRWIKRKKLARAYASSDALLSVSRGTADASAAYYGIPASKFEIVESPIDIAGIEAKAQASIDGILSPTSSGTEPPKRIVAVGRLSNEKGHRELLEAFALLSVELGKNYHLHIAGNGPLHDVLTQRIAELNLQDVVHLHGHLANPYPLMKQADLFVLPSHYEGLPNVLLEAMLLRCPVLATNTEQGAGEYLRNRPLGELVPVKSVSKIFLAMLDRFQNPQPWLDRIEPAYQHVRNHHHLDNWIQRISEILERVHRRAAP